MTAGKKRLFALLCALALCFPSLCAGTEYDCDECGYRGLPRDRVLQRETREDGIWEYYDKVCANCGSRIAYIEAAWRWAGPAEQTPAPTDAPAATDAPAPTDTPAPTDAPEATETPAGTPVPESTPTAVPEEPQATPETPATNLPEGTDAPAATETPAGTPAPESTPTAVPEEPQATPENPATNPPEGTDTPEATETPAGTPAPESTPTAAPETPAVLPTDAPEATNTPGVTDPPVITAVPETQAPVTRDPGSGPAETPAPALPEETLPPVIGEDTATPPPTVTPGRKPGAGGTRTGEQDRRNLRKYPVFSEMFPSRRLNLEGDPDAYALIPGERIWPEEETSSPLKKFFN